jgi:HK97 family phage prohead protease
MKRAYSLLEIREVGDESRTITGVATTPRVDSYGDIVEPEGVSYRGPVNLYLYHKTFLPVGNVEFGKASKAGIPFKATIPDVKEAGTVRERVNEAWHSVKYKLLQAVSIGFDPIEWEPLKDGGTRFKSWSMLELSLVGVPANPDAMIQTVKSAGMTDEMVREIRALDTACRKGIPLVSAREHHIRSGAVSLR